MPGQGPVLLGLGVYLLIATVPTLVFWVAVRVVPAVWERVAAWWGRRSPPAPEGPALECVVRDLRRLRRELQGPPPTTQVRRVALLAAYDGALLDTCRVVGVADPPLAGAEGAERAFARLLTEAAVEEAGVRLDPPGGRAAA
jgi:hypothetical protein